MASMQFGVEASQAHLSWPELLSLWQELDRGSEYTSLWVVDHLVPGAGSPEDAAGAHVDGWTALAALAMATSRVRVGVLVSGNTYRHPAVLAKMATTVDHISGGRLNFGIGAAWHEFEHGAYGLPFPTVRERLERLEEAVQLIKLLWTEPRPVFEGRYYQLDRPPHNPPNVQRPHPPILVGGSGERRTLRIVARYADACNLNGSPRTVRHKIGVLHRHCQDVGRDPKEIKVTAQAMLYLTDNPGDRQRVLRRVADFWGSDEGEIRRSNLIGTVEEAREMAAAYADIGVHELYFTHFPFQHHLESLLRFSREVVPAFR